MLIAGCGGGSAVVPAAASFNSTYTYVGRTLFVNGRPVTAARPPLSTLPRYETILPPPHHKKTFEYIMNNYESYTDIFDYPKSVAQIGTVRGVGGQGCTNVPSGYGKKYVWVVAAKTAITEYKVPSTKIRSLAVSYAWASSCAMNARGDLAVGILYGSAGSGPGGEVVIFKQAKGTGTVYTTPLEEEFFDGYDGQGNLFADGFTGARSGFALVELPSGSSKFETIKTSNSVQFPGSVQWDGTYLTVYDQAADAIFQYAVSGTKATLKGTVQLTGNIDCGQTWIVPGFVYCADSGAGDGEVFNYPAGGSPIATLTGRFDLPLGTTAVTK